MNFKARIQKWWKLRGMGRREKYFLRKYRELAKQHLGLRVARNDASSQLRFNPKSLSGDVAQKLIVDIDARLNVVNKLMQATEEELKILKMERERVINDL